MEASAIGAFSPPRSVPVNSIKGAIGHTLGAAGALEAVLCVEVLRRGVVPPTVGLDEIDPACAGLDLVRGRRDHTPPRSRCRPRPASPARTRQSCSAGRDGRDHGLGTPRDVPGARPAQAVRVRMQRTERVTQLALVAADEALGDGGPGRRRRAGAGRLRRRVRHRVRLLPTNAAYQRRLAAGGPAAASPRLFAATVSNAAAGEVGIAYGLGGPAVTLTAGAASGTIALAHAVDLLAASRADVLVAGGMDAAGPALERLLADAGVRTAGPIVEAATMLVLESPASAAGRDAHVHGTIAGAAVGFVPEPVPADARFAAVSAAALAEAGITDSDVELVLTHSDLEARVGPMWGAAGPLAVVRALDELRAGGAALVLDSCASGHVGALVVRRAML